eukprot:gene27673-49338_t
MILETMFRALGFRRMVFCLRDPKTEVLTGRFGLGEGSEAAVRAMKVPLKAQGDLFAAVCLRGADTLINDATEPRMQARLPQWYRTGLNAPSFLLLPLQIKGQPFALIYADQATAGGIVVDDKALGLLRTLRNQLRQSAPASIGLDELSMGMSGDFEIAIEEGATVVRVGQAIFGARPLPDSHYWPGELSTEEAQP